MEVNSDALSDRCFVVCQAKVVVANASRLGQIANMKRSLVIGPGCLRAMGAIKSKGTTVMRLIAKTS
jgi:hypothetical protein